VVRVSMPRRVRARERERRRGETVASATMSCRQDEFRLGFSAGQRGDEIGPRPGVIERGAESELSWE
jgi:hypothetical protein